MWTSPHPSPAAWQDLRYRGRWPLCRQVGYGLFWRATWRGVRWSRDCATVCVPSVLSYSRTRPTTAARVLCINVLNVSIAHRHGRPRVTIAIDSVGLIIWMPSCRAITAAAQDFSRDVDAVQSRPWEMFPCRRVRASDVLRAANATRLPRRHDVGWGNVWLAVAYRVRASFRRPTVRRGTLDATSGIARECDQNFARCRRT